MDYTDWLKRKFSSLSHCSSAETYFYIKKAKSETKFFRGFIDVAMFLSIVIPSNIFFSSMGGMPFENIIYWCFLAVIFLISSYLSKMAGRKIIKNKLAKIAQKNIPNRSLKKKKNT